MRDDLDAAYARCRELHRRHGRSYYLATRLLPAGKRRHVHALYGFARYADEIVDGGGQTQPERVAALTAWSARFIGGLHGAAVADPLLPAVLHTIATFDLDRADFAAFLRSMAMDLVTVRYARYADLLDYMEGSAAVIGTMMLPILGAADPVAAREPARQLGLAFQLTNIIRDVVEDLGRGRVYLPEEDLDRYGVTHADLHAAAARSAAPARIRALVRHEVERARAHYRLAAPGVTMLHPTSRAGIRTAYQVYGGILDEVAAAGYDVFVRRVAVPRRRRLAMTLRALLASPGTPPTVPGQPTAVRPVGRATPRSGVPRCR